tara:strand:+ start:1185 stop:1496 length:312 start_codon:yes stop_codon:yes gene_type:complete
MAQQDYFLNKIKEEPENKLFRFSLSKIYFDNGQYKEALPQLEKCAQLQEDWMLPRILLGKAMIELGALKSANSVLKQALDLAIDQNHEDPKNEILKLLEDLPS